MINSTDYWNEILTDEQREKLRPKLLTYLIQSTSLLVIATIILLFTIQNIIFYFINGSGWFLGLAIVGGILFIISLWPQYILEERFLKEVKKQNESKKLN